MCSTKTIVVFETGCTVCVCVCVSVCMYVYACYTVLELVDVPLPFNVAANPE